MLSLHPSSQQSALVANYLSKRPYHNPFQNAALTSQLTG